MNKALFVMDAQEDFIGEQRNREKFDYDDVDHLILSINERISYYDKNNYPVIYIATVYPNNFFFNKFIKYGIAGSRGSKIDRRIKIVSEYYFEKQNKDAFLNKNLKKFIKDNKIGEIELTGVDASYWVAKTAESARKLNLKVNINKDCVQTAYPNRIDRILKKLEHCGVAYI